jgi:hypothetical protein
MTVEQALRKCDRIIELRRQIARAKAESEAFIETTIAAIRERDNDRRFLLQCGIRPDSEV